MSVQILLILVYTKYTKKSGIWTLIQLFCCTTAMFNTRGYEKWLEMTIFDWYVDGMWCDCIHVMKFLLWWFASQIILLSCIVVTINLFPLTMLQLNLSSSSLWLNWHNAFTSSISFNHSMNQLPRVIIITIITMISMSWQNILLQSFMMMVTNIFGPRLWYNCPFSIKPSS